MASPRRRLRGSIVGGSASLGHTFRDGKFPPVSETVKAGIVIVGAGIAGLAAARQLEQRGVADLLMLELESQPGGNAISGANEVSAFPWAAHYVPIPGPKLKEVNQLFEDLGIITGHNPSGLPVYAEDHLCADPMERLFLHGRWQEGLVPNLGVTRDEARTIEAFFAEMQRLKDALGKDGRRAFAIPLDDSSQDEAYTRFDRMTMAEYLSSQCWLEAAPLRWYVDYCCRDDYGAGIEQVSAWAGIHYFAARDGVAANAPGHAVVTWPQGNGWIVQQIQRSLRAELRTGCAVWRVNPSDNHVNVDYYDMCRKRSVRLQARGVVWAAPHFVARRALAPLAQRPPAEPAPVYSPWVVANLTLDRLPTGPGMSPAWDNVLYPGRSLGYVVATHQNLHPMPRRTVITYYRPLDDAEPAVARQQALNRSFEEWCDIVLEDLKPAHPDLADHLLNLDVWIWGHAMIRPVPGFIWGPARRQMSPVLDRIVFAHSDLSGIAIFEEAYVRGVRAADALLNQLAPLLA
jgi:hypothetical protein